MAVGQVRLAMTAQTKTRTLQPWRLSGYHPGMSLLRTLLFIVPFCIADAQSPQARIKAVLTEQTAAWNSSDLTKFAATYAPACTLVGKSISHVTRAQVLKHYRETYPSPAKMGRLTFSDLQIDVLDPAHATAVARWNLDRDAASGGPVGGVFSLVLENRQGNWLIILDHTS